MKEKGLQQGECAKIAAFAAKLKHPLDGQDPSPIPPVRRVFICTMLRLVVAEAPTYWIIETEPTRSIDAVVNLLSPA